LCKKIDATTKKKRGDGEERKVRRRKGRKRIRERRGRKGEKYCRTRAEATRSTLTPNQDFITVIPCMAGHLADISRSACNEKKSLHEFTGYKDPYRSL
jgi:hypothetical protein